MNVETVVCRVHKVSRYHSVDVQRTFVSNFEHVLHKVEIEYNDFKTKVRTVRDLYRV